MHGFFSAAIPETPTILGLRLRPLSLGHILLLNRVRSSFVTEGEPFKLEDIFIAVLICSLPYREGCAALEDPDLEKFFTRWQRKISRRRWFSKSKPIHWPAIIGQFRDYIEQGSRGPQYSYNPEQFVETACPAVQVIKIILLRNTSLTEAEVLDRPWSLCLWDAVTIRMMDGHVRMDDPDKLIKIREEADRLAEILNARNRAQCPS